MMELAAFTLFVTFGVACLVIWPIMLHPTLPARRKWLLGLIAFASLVPLAIALYLWVGVPQRA